MEKRLFTVKALAINIWLIIFWLIILIIKPTFTDPISPFTVRQSLVRTRPSWRGSNFWFKIWWWLFVYVVEICQVNKMYFCIKWTMSENILDIHLVNRNVSLLVYWLLQCLTLGTLFIEYPVWSFTLFAFKFIFTDPVIFYWLIWSNPRLLTVV